jgi:Family of unknown function (DUF6279)
VPRQAPARFDRHGFINTKTGLSVTGTLFLLGAPNVMKLICLHASGLRLALLALIFSLLSGCSAIRVGYNQADTILAWMADDYFDFDPAQKQDFHTRIDRLLKWHRHEQLPDYARFLTEIKQRGQRQFTREDMLWTVDEAKARFRTLARHGADDAAEMLATLKPENIRALEKQFDKVNQKFVREYKIKGTVEDQKNARLERTLKQVREWAGTLTPAQEERIAAFNNTVPIADHLRHQDRQRRQKEFLALLNRRHNKAEFNTQVRAWLTDWEKAVRPNSKKRRTRSTKKESGSISTSSACSHHSNANRYCTNCRVISTISKRSPRSVWR